MSYSPPKAYELNKLCPQGHLLTADRLHTDKDGRNRCKTCRGQYSKLYRNKHKVRLKVYYKEWDAKNKELRYQVSRKSAMKYNYGITPEQFDALVIKQDNKCAICRYAQFPISGNRYARKKVMNLDIDHNPQNGVVRGLLCRRCNTALGLFRESPAILLTAHRYVATDGTSFNESQGVIN